MLLYDETKILFEEVIFYHFYFKPINFLGNVRVTYIYIYLFLFINPNYLLSFSNLVTGENICIEMRSCQRRLARHLKSQYWRATHNSHNIVKTAKPDSQGTVILFPGQVLNWLKDPFVLKLKFLFLKAGIAIYRNGKTVDYRK